MGQVARAAEVERGGREGTTWQFWVAVLLLIHISQYAIQCVCVCAGGGIGVVWTNIHTNRCGVLPHRVSCLQMCIVLGCSLKSRSLY